MKPAECTSTVKDTGTNIHTQVLTHILTDTGTNTGTGTGTGIVVVGGMLGRRSWEVAGEAPARALPPDERLHIH